MHSERVGKPTAHGPVRYETIQPYVSEHWGEGGLIHGFNSVCGSMVK